MTIRLGTRSSRLALWQSNRVASLLRERGVECELVRIETRGDDITDRPLPEIGGQGLFTERIESALRESRIDIAVHSLKDLPVEDAEELCVGAVLCRDEVREVLISRGGRSLEQLPAGAVIGSSSTRRQAQLLARRPDLVVKPIRGNVETRIRKVESGEYDATLLAAAGILRLGLGGKITQWLPLSDFLPAPGQGAIAVQCRERDADTRRLLAGIDEPSLRAETEAERGFLRALGGGCSAPVGAFARRDGSRMKLTGRVSALDGRRVVNVEGEGSDPAELAEALARQALGEGAFELIAAAGRRPPQPEQGVERSAPGALEGRRVVVTRPREQAADLCRMLADAGAVPLVVPLITIESLEDTRGLDEAIRRLESYDWLVLVSANGAERFAKRLAEIRPGFQWSPGRPRTAAVGPGTAAALARAGIRVEFVPSTSTGAGLAEELAGGQPLAGRRVLMPRALEGRQEAAEILRQSGAAVDDIPVYRTAPAAISAGDLAALDRGVDAVLFLSGSAVTAWQGQARDGGPLAGRAADAAVACIGPSTAAAARSVGLHVDVEAPAHSLEGLLSALGEHFARPLGRTP
jgi:hydroxymethylbilane synthase